MFYIYIHFFFFFFFFFNDTATTEIYTLSLHDALPTLPPLTWASISVPANRAVVVVDPVVEVGPAVEVGLPVAEPLVLAAWASPSSPPQPATSQQASSRPATPRRGHAIDASLSARHRVAAGP